MEMVTLAIVEKFEMVFNKFLEYHSINLLRAIFATEELKNLDFPINRISNDKKETLDLLRDFFLTERFEERKYGSILLLNSLTNASNSTSKDEQLEEYRNILIKHDLDSELENRYVHETSIVNMHVGGKPIDAPSLRILADELLKKTFIRKALLASLSGSSPLAPYNQRQYNRIPIVEEVMHILLSCSQKGIDIEQLMYSIPNHEEQAWIEFRQELSDMSGTNVTSTPRNQLNGILNGIAWPENILDVVYKNSMPENSTYQTPPNGTIPEKITLMLEHLAEAYITSTSIPIIKFAELLALEAARQGNNSIRDELRVWSSRVSRELRWKWKDTDNWLNNLREDIRAAPPIQMLQALRPQFLVIRVSTELSQTGVAQERNQKFVVDAWLMDNHNTIQNAELWSYKSEKSVLFRDIPKCINAIRKKFEDYLSDTIVFEIFLPDKYLSHPVDHWQISRGPGSTTVALGTIHPLVVRSLDRANNYQWREKWMSFQHYPDIWIADGKPAYHSHEENIHFCHNECYRERNRLFYCISPPSFFCLAFTSVLPSRHKTRILKEMLDAGIPFALWQREQTEPIDAFSNWLKEQLIHEGKVSKLNLEQLPIVIRDKRRRPANVPAYFHHITVLRDDPNRLPPGLNDIDEFEYEM